MAAKIYDAETTDDSSYKRRNAKKTQMPLSWVWGGRRGRATRNGSTAETLRHMAPKMEAAPYASAPLSVGQQQRASDPKSRTFKKFSRGELFEHFELFELFD